MIDPRITDEMERLRVSPEQYAAVEQAVIERLAGEAGKPPYHYATENAAFRQGAAAGVAAERARWEAKS
jgi:hypothetical protein